MQKEEEFVFTNIPERPVPSLLRGYSAPVRMETDLSDDDLFFLLAYDSDEFNRFVFISKLLKVYSVEQLLKLAFLVVLWFSWEAGQVLARKLMLQLVSDHQHNKTLVLNSKFVEGLRSILTDSSLDKVRRALSFVRRFFEVSCFPFFRWTDDHT